MRVIGRYSFKDGEAFIQKHHPQELAEMEAAIASIDSATHRTKTSREKTMAGKKLYSPKGLNLAFGAFMRPLGWANKRVKYTYSTTHYAIDYEPPQPVRKPSDPFRDMDFLKNGHGVEVQFGKYAFMASNVSAKTTIFHRLGFIDSDIEVVPLKQFADDMSTGVSYFEQIVWDLEQRGVAAIDIPELVLGIG